MAIVKLAADGQELQLDDSIAGDDTRLKQALSPFYPEAATANIRRETNSTGQMVVSLVKQAGTKGADPIGDILISLVKARQHINPALELTWQIQFRQALGTLSIEDVLALQPMIDSAGTKGHEEGQKVVAALSRLVEVTPKPVAAGSQAAPGLLAGF
jgi:hypothetical protein